MSGEWEDAPKSSKKASDKWEDAPVDISEDNESPAMAAVIGGAAGAVAKGTQRAIKVAAGAKKLYDKAVSTAPETVAKAPAPLSAATELSGSEKWLQSLTGQSVPGGQMDKEALQKAQEMAKTIGRGGELAGGTNVGGILLPPENIKTTAKAEREALQAAAKAQEMGKMRAAIEGVKGFAAPVTDKISKYAAPVGNFLNTGATGTALRVANPMLGLASAGAEYADMMNRFKHGDNARAVISGIGGLGSLASMAPNPVVKGVGAVAGISAPVLNALIDRLYGREGYAEGGLAQQQQITPEQIAQLRAMLLNMK